MITRKKFGLLVLALGVSLLLIGLVLLCMTDSIMAFITMVSSIFVNTLGLAVLMVKDK